MKLFLKITGYLFLVCIIILYLCFLFVLPNKLDLNAYMSDIQTIVSENSDFNINIGNLKLYTNPLLSVGVKAQDVKITYEDGSEFLNVPNADIRIAPLSVILLTIKSPSIVIDSPSLTLDIPDGKQLKILSVIEDMANRNIVIEKESSNDEDSFFNPSWIKIKLSKILVKNYSVIIKDSSTAHDISIKGDNLLAYYDGKKIKVKTDTKITNNKNENITSSLDVTFFIPKSEEEAVEGDSNVALAFPYINPVAEYEKINLKANADIKLKICQKGDKIWLKGYTDIDDLSAKFSDYELPKSYIHAVFRGYTVKLDSVLSYADNQNVKLSGDFNYGNGPWINMSFLTDKLYFSDMLKLTRSIMDSYSIKNNIDELTGSGYFQSDVILKTNFKNLDSTGHIDVVEGNISNKKFGNLVANINGLLEFDKRILKISKTKAYVNESNFKLEGDVDEKSNLNINVSLNKMPLTGLILKFAPKEIKNSYRIQKGLLSLDTTINGKLSKPLCKLDLTISDLLLKDIKNNIFYSNENDKISIKTNFKNVSGNVLNKGFEINIPSTNSKIRNEKFKINIGEENITFEPSNIIFNNYSLLTLMGEIQNYKKEPAIVLDIFGAINTADLNKLLGPQNAILMASKGALPFRVFIRGGQKVQNLVFQMISNGENYYTPVNIKSILGKTTLTQANARIQNGVLTIKNTGLYLKSNDEKLASDYELNSQNSTPIVEVYGTIIGLNTSHPSVNIIKLWAPSDLNINLAVFKNSNAILSLKTFIFGTFENIKTSGKIKISNLNIPEIQTTLEEALINFEKTVVSINVNKLLLDKSDINMAAKWDLHEVSPFRLNNVFVTSNFVDIDKLINIVDTLNSYITPKNVAKTSAKNQAPNDIPVHIASGNIFFKKIKTGAILVDNTRSNLLLKNNILSLKNLTAQIFRGNVLGNIDVNLLNNKITIDVKGSRLDVARALADVVNVKDALTGTASFKALISLMGSSYEEQVKSLKGAIGFEIKNGSFGPFGRLENLILAENIRESEFFQTALGGIINSLATIDTAHFDTLEGTINLGDGIADIQAIKSTGDVMSLLIFGDMNILKNELDVKLRGRLASNISDMLGPIAILNPVNLIKQTPGVNLVFAQAFTLFTVQVTQEELNELPSFSSGHSDENATGFQIVLSGDVNKPLKLIKSFKWLASTEDLEKAKAFMQNVMQMEKEEEEAQARRDRFNVIKKIRNAINKDDK